MNGISRTITPPFPGSGSYPQRYVPQYPIDVDADGQFEQYQFTQGSHHPSYLQGQHHFQTSYEMNQSQPFISPRMPSPAHVQQQPIDIYEGVRANASPYIPQSSQNMNVGQHRFQTATNYQFIYNMPQQTQYPNQQQLVMNPPMLQPSRLPIPSYASNQSSWNQPVQAQPRGYSQGYGNAPLYYANQGQPRSAIGQSSTLPRQEKRPKNPLPIVDPDTGKDILGDIHTSQNSEARGTPIGTEHPVAATSPHNDIAAQFAALVAAKLNTPAQIPDRRASLPAVVNSSLSLDSKEFVPRHFTLSNIQEPKLISDKNSVVITHPKEESLMTNEPAVTDVRPIDMNVVSTLAEFRVDMPEMIDVTEPVIEYPAPMDYNVSDVLVPSPDIVRANGLFHVVVEKCELEKLDNSEERPGENLVSIASVKEEAPQLEASDIKMEKSNKKAEDNNTKGECLIGTEFDAYTDDVKKEVIETADSSRSEEITEQPSKSVKPEQPPSQIPPPLAPVLSQTPTIQEEILIPPRHETLVPESTPDVEGIPKEEIMTEDVAEELLEDGEIVDSNEFEEEIEELAFKYADDQWSPSNPDGKKHYDREFLLHFQFDKLAICKPIGLPDIPDVVLDKPHAMGHSFTLGSQEFDFTPRYIFNTGIGSSGVGGSRSRGMPRPPSGQKNKGGSGPTRTINVSITKDIELHKAEKAWKPCRLDPKDAACIEIEDAATVELYKKTRSILNKLTPQKFDTLVSQMQALPIDTESKLKGVINLVFEKAISEPSFSVAYANMCKCLSSFIKVPSDSRPGDVHFRTVLLTACQLEFEKDNKSEDLFTNKRKEIEECEEGPKRDELKADLEYEETKARRRSLGNIRFIGELFKLKMLTENIMHICLLQLLKNRDEENLECLCRLLTTIGKELDFDKAKPRMDQYFQQMSRIVNEKKTSSRVRFMLQDVIDLRLSKWIPRQTDNNPKTIDQIHKEMEQEAHDKALQATQPQMQQKSNRGGRRGPAEQRGGGNSDGWNTVGGARAPLKSVDRSIDPSKMKLSKQNVDESVQLGPGGGVGKFSGWMRGSTGGTSGRSSLENERPSVPTNRFSALSKSEEESSRRNSGSSPARDEGNVCGGFSGSSPARGEGKGRGGFGQPPPHIAIHSQEFENNEVTSSAKVTNDSQSVEGVGRNRGRGNSSSDPQLPQEIPVVKVLTPEEVEQRAKAILDEYLLIHDTKEASTCIRELLEQNHHQCVCNFINHVLERSDSARKHTGQLLHDLVKHGVISIENYINGLVEVLESAVDLEIDIPKIWQYYGELISPMVQDGSVPFSFLKQAAQPLISNNKAGILLAEILLDACLREGHMKVACLWNESGLQWSDFVPKNQVEQFLVEKGLEFTKGGDSVPTTPTTGLPVAEIWSQLHTLIVDKNADNATVFDWIDSHVDEPTRIQPNFKRALMTAVCYSAIKGTKGNEKVEKKAILNRYNLLLKYLDHKPESELQALYAVQALVTKLEHPPGLMKSLFDVLYDEDVISEKTFLLWERSDEEPDGKGSAITQTIQFFTWLREAEEDS